jgi:hypothetical protein
LISTSGRANAGLLGVVLDVALVNSSDMPVSRYDAVATGLAGLSSLTVLRARLWAEVASSM